MYVAEIIRRGAQPKLKDGESRTLLWLLILLEGLLGEVAVALNA